MDRLVVPANLAAAVERDGRQEWLATLRGVIAELADRWSLRIRRPFEPGGETSWVAPARLADGGAAVVKVTWPHPEARDEAAGLQVWAGNGVVRLLRSEHLSGCDALLIERCLPGTALSEAPEPQQDQIVAALLRRLWLPGPFSGIQTLDEMCLMWAASAEDRLAGSQGLDPGLARAGIDLLRSLPAGADENVLLCTDLHAGNVLAAAREPWLVIDPKPHVGDPTYDVLQHMLNCEARLLDDPLSLIGRMAELAGLDADRLRLWLFARCVQESPNRPELADVARRVAP